MKNQFVCDDVTVIICAKNAEETIEKCIKSVLANHPYEVIIVDGQSIDSTIKIAEKYPVKILRDPGIGLAYARQLGLEKVRSRFVCYVGPDNIIARESLYNVKNYMIQHGWIGAGMLTKKRNATKNYFNYCTDLFWKIKIYEGERDVVGTPVMYYTDKLLAVGYDKSVGLSDDTDIEKRLLEINIGAKIGYSNVYCMEITEESFTTVKNRFRVYGRGDWQFWNKYNKTWTVKRKIRSLLHPLRDDGILLFRNLSGVKKKIYVMPYIIIIVFNRYMGWILERNKSKRDNGNV